jgi:hypothetical protein
MCEITEDVLGKIIRMFDESEQRFVFLYAPQFIQYFSITIFMFPLLMPPFYIGPASHSAPRRITTR